MFMCIEVSLFIQDLNGGKGLLKWVRGVLLAFITIGKDVCLASNICIWSLHHDYNDIHFAAKGAPVRIEDYAWLCSHCIILPGVTIGKGAVVASGAVVTKDIEAWTVGGGVPDKPIGKREEKKYDYHPGAYWVPFV